MFDSLLTVAGIIALFWVIIFVIYLFTSRQQRSIANEVESIEKKLEDGGSDTSEE